MSLIVLSKILMYWVNIDIDSSAVASIKIRIENQYFSKYGMAVWNPVSWQHSSLIMFLCCSENVAVCSVWQTGEGATNDFFCHFYDSLKIFFCLHQNSQKTTQKPSRPGCSRLLFCKKTPAASGWDGFSWGSSGAGGAVVPFSQLLSVNDEVVDRAPLKQALDFLFVGGLLPTCSQSNHNRVICKLNNRVRWKGGETVRGV